MRTDNGNKALEDSQERFRALHNASFGGICIHDKGLILDCNQGLSDMTGFTGEELIGMNGLELVAPEYRELVMQNILSRFGQPYDVEGLRKDGAKYHLRIQGKNIPYQGRSVRVTEFRDITDRKQAEEALRENEEKLSSLFGSMTEMVVLHEMVFNAQGKPVNYRIIDCNKAYTEIVGIAKEDAVGKTATEVYQTKDAPYLEEYNRVAITGEPCRFDTYFAPMDKHFTISVVSPNRNRFATISTDITANKKMQQLIDAKNKELEQMVYIASHDLRSPLVNIDGYGRELGYAVEDLNRALDAGHPSVDALKAAIQPPLQEMIAALGYIRNSTIQMDALLKGILKLSRSGRSILKIGPLNMNELISRTIAAIEFQVREAGVDLHVSDLPPCQADALQVTQVFSNLIGNALKFLDPKRPGVIRINGSEKEGRCLYCVEDNGIGIDPAHQQSIFEIFRRLDPAKSEGEGLGLTIVRQVLERLAGEIRVESIPGEGSRFYVALPAIPSHVQIK